MKEPNPNTPAISPGNTTIFKGSVERIIYQNIENGYVVMEVLGENGTKTVVCIEACLPGQEPSLGDFLVLRGSFMNHHKYGMRFSALSYERRQGSPQAELLKYLAQRNIRGIGRKRANQIIGAFGDKASDVLESHPEQLATIRGIGLKLAQEICQDFREKNTARKCIIHLQGLGLNPVIAKRLYEAYKDRALEIISSQPYTLADIYGIGFKTADAIAARMGTQAEDAARIAAGVRHCLGQAATQGHVYLPLEELSQKACLLLGVGHGLVAQQISAMQLERVLWQDTQSSAVYLNGYAYSEALVAKKLLGLAHRDDAAEICNDENLKLLKSFESEQDIALAKAQQDAVLACLSQGVVVITGGPGTGKTTTIRTVISIMHGMELNVALCAPTGRAAKRMSEATGFEAKTIHRLLEVTFTSDQTKEQHFGRNKNNPLECDVVIVDEASMIDTMLMANLVSALPDKSRLVLVGDVDQLPSVGAGNVLKDIINSGCISVVRLGEIFRQAQESAIIMNAHRINSGQYPILNESGKDFFIIEHNTPDVITQAVCDLVARRLPSYLNTTDFLDIQVLTPMRKSGLGAAELNMRLQEVLNPPNPINAGNIFRLGDKVMQMRNNYTIAWKHPLNPGEGEGTGVFNGDMGIIINTSQDCISVLFDGERLVEYESNNLDELSLAYATTVHKAQGSEYRAVVLPIYNTTPPILFTRNLLYTAITRARELVVVVGPRKAIHSMVDNNRETHRYTSLDQRMIKMRTMFQ